MANHLPERLESSSQQSEIIFPRQGTPLQGRLDETLEIFNGLKGKYALFSDFLQESGDIATKQTQLARELNDEISKRRLFVKGERIEIGGQTSTIRATANPDFYSISKKPAHASFFDGRFVDARVIPIPEAGHYELMSNAKNQYAEWTSNRYGLTFMFDQMAVVFPSTDYPSSPDGIEAFPTPFTLVPVEYPGIDLRSVDIAREEVMELFNGKDRTKWPSLADPLTPTSHNDEGNRGL